jgi:hypothetical protein
MPKRRSDADHRRFFDEFASLRVSRLRATGVIDPGKRYALIPVGERQKLIGTAHVRFPNGGGYSYFRCPRCDRLAGVIYLIDDEPRCRRCCAAIGIVDRSAYGFGRCCGACELLGAGCDRLACIGQPNSEAQA